MDTEYARATEAMDREILGQSGAVVVELVRDTEAAETQGEDLKTAEILGTEPTTSHTEQPPVAVETDITEIPLPDLPATTHDPFELYYIQSTGEKPARPKRPSSNGPSRAADLETLLNNRRAA